MTLSPPSVGLELFVPVSVSVSVPLSDPVPICEDIDKDHVRMSDSVVDCCAVAVNLLGVRCENVCDC